MAQEGIEKVKISDQDKKEAVEFIVIRWNEMVKNIQNTTISLCLMIKERMKDYPNATVREILDEVKKHPNIKRFVSIDRIWQGLRLVHNRPDVIDYHKKGEEERKVSNKPYIKPDGEVFWEFYFELEKAPFDPLRREMLEKEGKSELWSFRKLKQKIQELKDDRLTPIARDILSRRKEKYELLRQSTAVLQTFPLEKLRDAYKLLLALRKQDIKELAGDKIVGPYSYHIAYAERGPENQHKLLLEYAQKYGICICADKECQYSKEAAAVEEGRRGMEE